MARIDHSVPIDIPDNDAVNELGSLASLRTGLSALYYNVLELERVVQEDERLKNRRRRFTVLGSNIPVPEAHLLDCFFQWFGTSLCNYVRLIGYLEGLASKVFTRDAMEHRALDKKVRDHCVTYLQSVPGMIAVKTRRDKVAAHFAITGPWHDDNAALLDLSVMPSLVYRDRRFRVGEIQITSRGADASLPPWSVTEIFESLGPRYWPDLKLSAESPT